MFVYVLDLSWNRYPIRFYTEKKDFFHAYERSRIYVSKLEEKYKFRDFRKI